MLGDVNVKFCFPQWSRIYRGSFGAKPLIGISQGRVSPLLAANSRDCVWWGLLGVWWTATRSAKPHHPPILPTSRHKNKMFNKVKSLQWRIWCWADFIVTPDSRLKSMKALSPTGQGHVSTTFDNFIYQPLVLCLACMIRTLTVWSWGDFISYLDFVLVFLSGLHIKKKRYGNSERHKMVSFQAKEFWG